MLTEVPPFAVFYVGAIIACALRGRARSTWFIAVPLISAAMLLAGTGASGAAFMHEILGLELILHRPDKLSLVFGYVFHIAAILGAIFSWRFRNPLEQPAALVYAGSALGAVFCGDLVSLFIFSELMAFSAAVLVLEGNRRNSAAAGTRYMVTHILAGVLLLAGTILHYAETGSTEFTLLGLSSMASYLIFFAFGIKCAFPLLHNWLTDSYPESTPNGMIFLSALTSKVAVYALARGFAGSEVLIYIGVAMTCFPIFYAVIENDLRRVLAYSMINQVGFMVCGIGIGTELALNGAVAHAFTDVIFKGLLMMSMGAVLYRTGKINGSDLGGLYRSMPKTATLCIIGAASISAFPLFSGFVSKSMIMSAAVKEGYHIVWIGLLFASAGVFHHAGIKIPYFAFFAHDSGIRVKEAPASMLIAMGIAAALCIGIGVFPGTFYSILPFDVAYSPYDTSHVLAQIQLLLFSALAFVWLQLSGIYPPELRGTNIDAEWIYRKAVPGVYRLTARAMSAGLQTTYAALVGACRYALSCATSYAGETSPAARTATSDKMTLLVIIALSIVTLLFFI